VLPLHSKPLNERYRLISAPTRRVSYRWMENDALRATQTSCVQCGTIADTGRIFCANCGAALRAAPLIPHTVQNETQNPTGRTFMSSRSILFVFSLCALVDFAWSMLERRSVVESAISAILGLFGTGWYLLTIWASSHNDPDDPIEPARWVP
jgi:hypothetical protein